MATSGSTLRWLSLLIVIVFAAIWGGIDGIRDRRNFPEPEDGADLTMLWLKAALVGGFVAGAASWALSLVPSLELTQQGLFFEVTSGAAFTILLIFVPAMIAITVGRFFVSREQRKNGTAPQTPSHERHHEPVPVSEGYDSPPSSTHTAEPPCPSRNPTPIPRSSQRSIWASASSNARRPHNRMRPRGYSPRGRIRVTVFSTCLVQPRSARNLIASGYAATPSPTITPVAIGLR
ncbi:B-4DMT family transporter [Rhodococcus sp. 3Y1]